MLAVTVLSMPCLTIAASSTDRMTEKRLPHTQSTTQPITLRSVTGPNENNSNPDYKSNWLLEIKALTSALTVGATVKLNVVQVLNPTGPNHMVKITQVNAAAIVFGPSVQGISTASVTVPVEAVGETQGGLYGVNLQASATITEAGTARVTTSSVNGTYPFTFPQSNDRLGSGGGTSPVPMIPAPGPDPVRIHMKHHLYVEDYYDWYVGDADFHHRHKQD